ncbi:MAG: hypothetical protein WBQ83_23585, partial [Candidatus Acidiferrales bacterium]
FLFCAFVCFSLAEKTGSVIGVVGAAEVIAYGGTVGLGVAVSTQRQLPWSLGLRMLFGILWIIVLTTFYFWVFRAVSYGTNREVLFRGAAFAFPPAAILVLRGITAWLKTSRKLDDGRTL